ncbi:MAG: nitroreductase family protein [Gemmatimonadales bacterium]
MRPSDAIRARRSIKRFADRPITRAEIEALLDAAALAPNHRLTQPWRFYVLGAEARHAYGLALGARKARKLPDPTNADAVRELRERIGAEHRALPAVIAVAVVDDAASTDQELRDENYAAAMMAVENIAIAAVELGLGTHIKTGAIMADPAARDAAGVRAGERIVAVVNVGEPAELPPPKKRDRAAGLTTWVP